MGASFEAFITLGASLNKIILRQGKGRAYPVDVQLGQFVVHSLGDRIDSSASTEFKKLSSIHSDLSSANLICVAFLFFRSSSGGIAQC